MIDHNMILKELPTLNILSLVFFTMLTTTKSHTQMSRLCWTQDTYNEKYMIPKPQTVASHKQVKHYTYYHHRKYDESYHPDFSSVRKSQHEIFAMNSQPFAQLDGRLHSHHYIDSHFCHVLKKL